MAGVWRLEKNKDTPLELYASLVREERRRDARWKWLALGAAGCLVAALAVMAWAVRLPKTVPLVITVSDWGEARYAGAASNYSWNGMKVPDIAIEYQLRKFVTNRFAIPYDPHVLRENLRDCYSALTGASASKLSSEIRADNPMDECGKRIVKAEVETVLRLSAQSYQVDFITTAQEASGRTTERRRMRGVLAVKLMQPADEDQTLNPLGIYITDFDFTEIKEAAK